MRNIFGITSLSLLTVLTAAAAGCGTQVTDTEDNINPPVLKIITPTRGTMGDKMASVQVTGTAIPQLAGTPIQSVTVNGVDAPVAADGSFAATVPVAPGTTLLHTSVKDQAGNEVTDTRAVQSGSMTTADAEIQNAMSASISATAFSEIADAATNLLNTTDFETLLAPENPLLNAGDPNGPDCLYAQGSITDFNIQSAKVQLIPQTGALAFAIDVYGLDTTMPVQYAAACIDGNTTVTVHVDHIQLTASLALNVVDNKLSGQLNNTNVVLSGLNVDATGLPGDVLNIVDFNALATKFLPGIADKMLPKMVDAKLQGIGGISKSVAMMGKTIDIDVIPESVSFTPAGGIVTLDSRIDVEGSETGPGFIFTPNTMPSMDAASGIKVALADDVANQLLAGFYAVGGLGLTLPINGGAFDSATTDPKLAPMISADATDGSLHLLAGDMGITFTSGSVPVAKIAVNADIAVSIVESAGAVKLVVGTPTLYVDMLDDEVPNTTGFKDSDLTAIVKVVAMSQVGTMSTLVGAVPVPSMAGVTISNLDLGASGGYVTLTGDIVSSN